MSSPSSVQDRPAPSGGSAGPADEEESGSGRERNWSLTSLAVKVVALGTVVGVAFALTPTLVSQGRWGYLVALWLATVVVLAVYGTGRAVPAKYLLPGVLLLIALVVYPAVRTGQISLTNYGDGTRTTQAETVASILGSSVVQTPDAPRYNLSVGTTGTTTTGPFTFFLVPVGEDEVFRGDAEGLEEVTDDDGIAVEDGFVTEADGFELLTPVEINDAGAGLGDFTVPTEDGAIRRLGIRQAFEGRTTLEYDESSETFTDVTTGTTYTPQQRGDRQLFVSEDGQRLSQQSWLSDVGLDNYERALTNDRIRNDFIRIFLWTLAFATLSVASTFALGLGLAVVLNDPRVRGQRLYRSLLLLPYAVPGFISLLVWSSFYNRDFGLINDLTGLSVNWFGGEWTAKFAVLLTNLWMGFPYMFLVCTGALQAIPGYLKEAASIDGASGWYGFRRITLPMLLVPTAPLLVASFALNFNNFNAIELLTEGGPFTPDNPTAGGTDILISYTIRLAFGAGGQELGFASAIAVLLFVLTGVIAAFQFRFTKAFEEMT